MTDFFTPANVISSGFLSTGSDIVEIDPSKRVLIGLASTDVVGGGLITKTFFGVVESEVNDSQFFVSIFGGLIEIVSTKGGTGTVLPMSFSIVGFGEVMRMATNGNVGFSNSSPLVKVHATSGADGWNVYSERSSGAITGLYASTTQGRVGTNTNHPLGICVNNTDYLYIDATGKIGIHNAAPGVTVDITGDLRASGSLTSGSVSISGSPANNFVGTGINAITNFSNVIGGTFSITISAVDVQVGTTTANDLSIVVNSVIATTIFNATGNISINSGTDFGNKLYVNGSIRADGAATLNDVLSVSGESRFLTAVMIGINSSPDPSAILDLSPSSPTQGFLPPRMSTAQRNAISSPARGLIIFNVTTGKLNVQTAVLPAITWEAVTSA